MNTFWSRGAQNSRARAPVWVRQRRIRNVKRAGGVGLTMPGCQLLRLCASSERENICLSCLCAESHWADDAAVHCLNFAPVLLQLRYGCTAFLSHHFAGFKAAVMLSFDARNFQIPFFFSLERERRDWWQRGVRFLVNGKLLDRARTGWRSPRWSSWLLFWLFIIAENSHLDVRRLK